MRRQRPRAVEAGILVVATTALIATVMLSGCAEQKGKTSSGLGGGAPREAALNSPVYTGPQTEPVGGRLKQGEAAETRSAPGAEEMQEPPAAGVQRRIKYTADLSLIVQDFDPIAEHVSKLARAHHGYVAQANISGSPGSPRSGHWRIRLPVDDLDPFLIELVKLGVPEHNVTDSQDVTAEYVDLEARLKNKKEQEETLRGYLKQKQTTSELKDILTVEQEVTRVRGEIEHLEGQLRVLANLTALTTVTLSVHEIKNYVPPQAPSFGTTVARAFDSSWMALVGLGKICVLGAVVAVPWIPLATVLTVGGFIAVRSGRSSRTAAHRRREDTIS